MVLNISIFTCVEKILCEYNNARGIRIGRQYELKKRTIGSYDIHVRRRPAGMHAESFFIQMIYICTDNGMPTHYTRMSSHQIKMERVEAPNLQSSR